jgi:hypothetical protein
VGWKIGSGINARFLKLGVPEAIPHTNTDFRGNGSRQYLTWHSAGYSPYFDRVIQPVDGFTWTRQTDSGSYGYWRTGAPENTCDHNRVAAPLALTIQTRAFATKDCGYGEDRASTDYHIAYVTEDDLGAPAPIEPYTNQPYTTSSPAPTAPPQATVEQTIEEQLDKPENELLRDWLNYQLGSPGAEDPTGIGAPNPVVVPSPEEGETATEYAARLDALRLRTAVTEVDVADPMRAPSEVISVEPQPGTAVQTGREIAVRTNRTKDCEISLFHYTDLPGAAGIIATSRIIATDQNGPYPPGAYATTITPLSPFYEDQYELAVHLFSEGEKPVSWWVKLCAEDNPAFHPTQAEFEWAPPDFWNASALKDVPVPIVAAGTGPNPMPRGF